MATREIKYINNGWSIYLDGSERGTAIADNEARLRGNDRFILDANAPATSVRDISGLEGDDTFVIETTMVQDITIRDATSTAGGFNTVYLSGGVAVTSVTMNDGPFPGFPGNVVIELTNGGSITVESLPFVRFQVGEAGPIQTAAAFTTARATGFTVPADNTAPAVDVTGTQSLTITDGEATTVVDTGFDVTSSDPESDTITLSISDARFEIVGGEVRVVAGSTFTLSENGDTVTVTAEDDGFGTLTDTATFTIAVLAVNAAPVIDTADLGTQTLKITDATATTTTDTGYKVSASDADAGDSLTFTLAGDARFELTGSGNAERTISVIAGSVFDRSTAETITLTATVTDDNGIPKSDTQTYTITISANTAPLVDITGTQTLTITDGLATTTVDTGYDVTASDPDGDGFTVTISDSARFEIVNNEIRVKAGSIFTSADNGDTVTVTVTDDGAGNLVSTDTFALRVDAVVIVPNEDPTITSSGTQAITINENDVAASQTQTGFEVTFADPNTGDVVALTVSDDRFELTGTGATRGVALKSGATFDFETEPTITLTITATDNGGPVKSASVDVTITIANADDAPTAFVLDNEVTNIAENTVITTQYKVADLDVTDEDVSGFTNTFTLSGADADDFRVDGTVLSLRANTVLNREVKASYSVIVTVAGNTALTQTLNLAVNDVNEAPVVVNSEVLTNPSAITVLTASDLLATDVDVSDTPAALTYTVTDASVTTGTLEKLVSGVWTTLANAGTFTQADVNNGNIRFVANTGTAQTDTTLTLSLADGLENSVTAVTVTLTAAVRAPFVGTGSSFDASSETTPQFIDAGDGNDAITGGSANDYIIGGLGNDTISLAAGGSDTVVYDFGANGVAVDGGDRITGFKRGDDKLVLTEELSTSTTSITLADFLASARGADLTSFHDDLFIVTPDYIKTGANFFIEGVTLNFREAGIYDGNKISSGLLTIRFDVNVPWAEFLALAGGEDAFDKELFALKDPTALIAIFGADSIALESALAVSDTPTAGTVSIDDDGTPVTGEALTANTSTLDDADDSSLSFTYQWSDANGVITGATGETYTPTAAGSYTVAVVAFDSVQSITSPAFTSVATTVAAAANTPPVANADTGTAAEDGAQVSGNVVTNDVDANSDTLEVTAIAGGTVGTALIGTLGTLTLQSTGAYTYTADNADALADGVTGDDVFTYTVSDNNGGTATATLTITVTGINDAPTVGTPIPDQNAEADAAILFAIPAGSFADADTGAALTYTTSALPAWLAFAPLTQVFTGTPPVSAVGSLTVTVTASDGTSSVTDSFDFTIAAATITNAPPVLTFNGAVASASEAVTFAENTDITTAVATVTATDANGADTLNYSLDGVDKLLFEISATGVLTFLASPNFESAVDTGADNTYDVTVMVNDGATGADRLVDTVEIRVTVTNVNEAPTLVTSFSPPAATEDALFTYIIPADAFDDVDAADATLTYSISSGTPLPSWLGFDAANRTFSGTPTNSDGTSQITVIATDAAGLSAQRTFFLLVDAVNDAPVVANEIPDATATVGVELTITSDFTDVDNTSLTYSATGRPAWLILDTATGILTGTPASGDIATVTIVLTATDAAGLSATDTFVVTTEAAPVTAVAPIFTIGNAAQAVNVAEGDTAVAQYLATDANGTTPTYTLSGDDMALFVVSATGELAFLNAPDFETATDVGADNVYNVIITATDGSLIDTLAVVVTVTNVDEATVGTVAIGGDATVGQPLSAVIGDAIGDGDGITGAVLVYQWFNAGTAISGASAATYTLQPSDEGDTITVSISFTDDGGFATSITSPATLPVAAAVVVNPAPTVASAIADMTLAEDVDFNLDVAATSVFADTDALTYAATYTAVLEGGATATPTWLTLTSAGVFSGTPDNDDVGVVTVIVTATDTTGTNSVADTFTITVTNVDDAATGTPSFTGTPTVGQALTAVVTAIVDVDGLPDVSTYTYQWLNAGADISGATSSTYTLQASDATDTISLRVGFTDRRGGTEVRTSTQTAVIAAAAIVDSVTTGSITIDHTEASAPTTAANVGETLKIATNTLTDTDDSQLTYTYQWSNADGVITGATEATYVTTAAGSFTLVITAIDDVNTVNTPFTSNTVTVVAAGTTPPASAKAVSITGLTELKIGNGALEDVLDASAATGAQVIQGGALADTITGSAHGDVIASGYGMDTITLGAGADTVVYRYSSDAAGLANTGASWIAVGGGDTINNFKYGVDKFVFVDITAGTAATLATWEASPATGSAGNKLAFAPIFNVAETHLTGVQVQFSASFPGSGVIAPGQDGAGPTITINWVDPILVINNDFTTTAAGTRLLGADLADYNFGTLAVEDAGLWKNYFNGADGTFDGLVLTSTADLGFDIL